MKTSYVVIGIIVAALLVGLVVVMMQQADNNDEAIVPTNGTQQEAQEPGEDETETVGESHGVVFSNSGFSPSEIVVSQGDTVVFRNDSSGNVWIASDPHPSHTDYPEFDSGSSIASGNDYAFTFERTGRWGYHNHLNPSQTGTVVVE